MKDRLRCKARCITYGKTLEMRATSHNHEYTFKGQYEALSSQILNIQYGKLRNPRQDLSSREEMPHNSYDIDLQDPKYM